MMHYHTCRAQCTNPASQLAVTSNMIVSYIGKILSGVHCKHDVGLAGKALSSFWVWSTSNAYRLHKPRHSVLLAPRLAAPNLAMRRRSSLKALTQDCEPPY